MYWNMWMVFMSLAVFVSNAGAEEDVLKYVKPSDDGAAFFAEPFHSNDEFESRWKLSEAKKDGVDDSIAKYDGKWTVTEPKDNPIPGDNGLVLSSEAKHAAVSASLKNPFKFEDSPLVVQYEVRFQKKQECGGAYVKLLAESDNLKLEEFGDKTEYTIMFGPDKCGGDGKLHFIFQHKNPITHKMEEKHAKKPSGDFAFIFDDGKTHLVGLIVRPDNSFEIQVDKVVVNAGNLLKDMEPPVNPPKLVDDPDDVKPEDWDEREKITDPNAEKPADWDEDAPKTILDPNAQKPAEWLDDEPELVADPAASMPQDWDEAEDGEWEAPQIPNPKCKAAGCGEWKPPSITNPAYKGKWTAPLIDNPDYKGIWKAKQVENPNYFEDDAPFRMKSIAAVGFELWSMQSDILFDNLIIADDMSIANQWTVQTWDLKHSKEASSGSVASGISGLWNSFMEATQDKPWLWIVVVVALLLPIVMIYLLCCSGGAKDDAAARYKKTDEVVPDDDESADSPAIDEVSEENVEETAEEDATDPSDDVVEETPKVEEVSEKVENKEEEKKTEDITVQEKVEEVVEKKEEVVEKESVKEEVKKVEKEEPAKEEEKADIEETPTVNGTSDEKLNGHAEEEDSAIEEVQSENVEKNILDATSDDVPEEIPQPSPITTRAGSKKKLRKDS